MRYQNTCSSMFTKIAFLMISGTCAASLSAQENPSESLSKAKPFIIEALNRQANLQRSITGVFESNSIGKGKNSRDSKMRSYEFGLDKSRFYLALLDQKLRPTDLLVTHRLEFVSDGVCLFEVAQAKSGGGYLMRQFESKPDRFNLDFYRYQADVNQFFMRGLTLLSVLRDKSFEFTKIDVSKGEFGDEWALDFKLQMKDNPFRTGSMTFFANKGFILKNLTARPAAPYDAQLMSVKLKYSSNDKGELIPELAQIDDVNINQIIAFSKIKVSKSLPDNRFSPKYFGLPDPRELKSSMQMKLPVGYFAVSFGFLMFGVLAK